MMKIVFVGSSLPNARNFASEEIDIRPPACQGDVMLALRAGATAIGLIDGQFEKAAPVWHKELLFALSQNIPVFGAASMGALRAAECAEFGMAGVGRIFNDYASGIRVDDADVALDFGPAELGYPALSIPLVNAEATISKISELELLNEATSRQLLEASRKLFFKKRNWKTIAELSRLDFAILKPIVTQCWTDQKKLDAIELIEVMNQDVQPLPPRDWHFNATSLFQKMYF